MPDPAIILGRLGGGYLVFPGQEHIALYAPTRSGKGVSCVIPNCLSWPHSIVVLDVKRENWRATAGWRASTLGQDCYLFDPLSPDRRTSRFNPLSSIDRKADDRFDQIQRIAQAIFPETSISTAKFWEDAARAAFCGAACFVAETPGVPLTIASVLRLFSAAQSGPFMREQIGRALEAGHPYSLACVESLKDYLTGGVELVNGIRKAVTTRLALWYNPVVAAATETSDFDLAAVRSRPMSIYVGVNPGDIERLRPLLSLFFQQLVTLNTRLHPDEDPSYQHQVLVLLDEFPTLGAMQVLAHAFPFVAGYGIRMLVVCQSRAQLRSPSLYGEHMAEAIFDNCGVEVVFGTKNWALCEELSRRAGNNTVDSVTRHRPRFFGSWAWSKQTQAAHPHARPLLLPQEVARMRDDQQLVFRAGMKPIMAGKIKWYADPVLRKRTLPRPVVPAIDVAVPLDDGGLTVPASSADGGRGLTRRRSTDDQQEMELQR